MLMAMTAVVMMGSLSSCKKDKKDPDPRDAFIGEYAMTLSCDNGYEGDGPQKITKSTSNEREVIFEDMLGMADVRAEVSGTSFIYKKTTVNLEDSEGTPFQADLTGSGTLNGKKLTVVLKFKNAGVGFQNSCEASGEKK